MTSASTVRSDLIAANILESTLSALVNRWVDVSDFFELEHFGAGYSDALAAPMSTTMGT
jgi:hypothetical protein